jgi:hypothetical protein
MELHDDDFNNVNPGEPRILIPEEGWYPAHATGYEAKRYGGWGEKLIVRWMVFTSTDKSSFTMLDRYYNLQRDMGKRFKFGPLHDYRKDWIASNGGRHSLERSRLPISIWKEGLYLVEVVTVRHDSKGRHLSPSLYWSKIGRVIRPLKEGERWEGLPFQPLNFTE